MKHSIVMNATKTRSRYVSLAAVLSDQNTVAKDRPLPSVFLCLWSLCTIKYPFSESFAIAYRDQKEKENKSNEFTTDF